jgi:DNA-binding HxlR family transcriptional regulator
MRQIKPKTGTRDRDDSVGDIEEALKCLEGRWKLLILSHLFASTVLRFSELERAIPSVSQKMLIQQLRELERDGIVLRTVHPQVPPKVEYGLTAIGRALTPVFEALLNWAAQRSKSPFESSARRKPC